MKSFRDIIIRAKESPAKPKVALVPGDDITALTPLLTSELADTLVPVLIGDREKINHILDETNSSSRCEIIDIPDIRHALREAVSLVQSRSVEILMQGKIKNTLFRDIVLHPRTGIAVDSTVSHVSILENERTNRLIMITDTMMNEKPTLAQKCSILESAIGLAHVLGIEKPRVAVIAALEYINPLIPSTTDAAIISKMGERHQFGDVVVDGPLDIDCAVSMEASKRKKVMSPVTESADIFLVTDAESGCCFAQVLGFIGRMPMAGILLGAGVPVILNMPSLSPGNRITELAVAKLLSER